MKKINKTILITLLISAASAKGMQTLDNTPAPITFKAKLFDTLQATLFKGVAKFVTQETLNKKLYDTLFINPDHRINYIKSLIKSGANVNAQFKHNMTPLHAVLTNGYFGNTENTVNLLLDNNAQVNNSIIQFAKDHNNPESIIKKLQQSK